MEIRHARAEDYAAVEAFTRDTWPDRESRDYIPRIYHEWIAGDGETQRTFVADAGDGVGESGETPSENVAGIVQGVLLTEREAWSQGMRVHPGYRGRGLSRRLSHAVFEWASERGAAVCRSMAFSWNTAGLGAARAAGFEPAAQFRWAKPDPASTAGSGSSDPERAVESGCGVGVGTDPDAAWSYWTRSDARTALGGLALDREESWALSELSLGDLRWAADETAVFAVRREAERSAGSGCSGGPCGLAFRVRDYDRTDEDGTTERWAVYGVGDWADVESARALFAAIARDAAEVGADRTRVLIPETPRHVTDAAWSRAGLGENSTVVFEADLNVV